jgi:hypothetical protein
MRKIITLSIIIIGLLSFALAEITLTGDARVRPRIDTKTYGDYGTDNVNNYYMYRARINMKASLGDGWHFSTKLGTNDFAYWTGKFGSGDTPSSSSLSSAGRGSLSFMELYFGLKRDNFGFAMGVLPLSGFKNPGLDLHFYPSKVVDIPWLIYNNNAYHGFSAYYKVGPGKLNALLSVDNNVTQTQTIDEVEVTASDQMTLMLNYGVKFAGISVNPWLMTTLANEGESAPMTIGANFKGPKLAGFTPAASYFMTSQEVDETSTYTGNIMRFNLSGKIGPGSLYFWYDIASVEWDGGDTHDYTYLWAHYKYVVFKSDKGEFSLKPTIRIATDFVDDVKDYSRSKFELTMEMKF